MVIKTQITQIKEVDLKRLLGGKSVYVGYPEDSTRDDGELTNAQIAYLNTEGTRPLEASRKIREGMSDGTGYDDALAAYITTNGDPRWHIPPRPFVEPAIEKSLSSIHNELKQAAIANIEKQDNTQYLQKAGIRAVNAVRKFIRDYPENGLEPNAPSTIEAKGEDHPLKGKTGQLIGRVTYVVD